MSFFIQEPSLPWVGAAETARAAGLVAPEAPHGRADDGVTQLRADYGRVSRWLLGLLATVVAAIATVLIGVGVDSALDPAMLPEDRAVGAALGIGIGLVLAAPATWLLITLHRSGRRLATGLAFWVALPYRTGQRSPEGRDFFVNRFVAFEPYLLIRVITSVAASLATVFAVSMVFYAILVSPLVSLAVSSALAALLFGVCGVGQFGGVQRIQNGYAHRDPWWDSWRRGRTAP